MDPLTSFGLGFDDQNEVVRYAPPDDETTYMAFIEQERDRESNQPNPREHISFLLHTFCRLPAARSSKKYPDSQEIWVGHKLGLVPTDGLSK
ncbi:hypothetical protein CRG98_021072 [Punica granatum]|uniref:Uncharacterized protein n=1 Tax=Punica granatum TaxID=22663 RepID=A0A2I0JQI1_PUNGR|nr:hypothetical protein CRG98_021072 [Punica granatum]